LFHREHAYCTAVLIAITRIALLTSKCSSQTFVGRAPPGFAGGAYRTWLVRPLESREKGEGKGANRAMEGRQRNSGARRGKRGR